MVHPAQRCELRTDPVEGLAGVPQLERGPGVGDGHLALGPVANDAGVAQEPLDVGVTVSGHLLGVEAVEGPLERRSLAQDGDPRQAGLEPLEDEEPVELPLVVQRPPPLLVVVGDIGGVVAAPPAPRLAVGPEPNRTLDGQSPTPP